MSLFGYEIKRSTSRPPKPDKIKQQMAYTASFLILIVFLSSEPARVIYNFLHENANMVFDESWKSTLTNLTLLAVGVLIGKSQDETHPRPPPKQHSAVEDKGDS